MIFNRNDIMIAKAFVRNEDIVANPLYSELSNLLKYLRKI